MQGQEKITTRTHEELVLLPILVMLMAAALFHYVFKWQPSGIVFYTLIIGLLVWSGLSARIGGRTQKIVQSWSSLIQDAADHAEKFLEEVEELILSRETPGLTEANLKVQQLRDEMTFSAPRPFLVIHQQGAVRLYRIYISVRPYGKELQVSWYLVLQPGFFRRLISRLLPITRWDPFALWEKLPVFGHQDLHAHASVVHACVKEVMQVTMEKLGKDFSKVDTKSEGVLNLW